MRRHQSFMYDINVPTFYKWKNTTCSICCLNEEQSQIAFIRIFNVKRVKMPIVRITTLHYAINSGNHSIPHISIQLPCIYNVHKRCNLLFLYLPFYFKALLTIIGDPLLITAIFHFSCAPGVRLWGARQRLHQGFAEEEAVPERMRRSV